MSGVTGGVAVVTGAASGIGRAIAARLAADGARTVVLGDCVAIATGDPPPAATADRRGPRPRRPPTAPLVDTQADLLERVAADIGGIAVPCDVTREADVVGLVDETERRAGPVDVYVSNAGVYRHGGEEAPDDVWELGWNLHVMAHVYAARRLIPGMVERGGGAFVITSSAAGLLSHLSSASYPVTKHAAVAFGEFLAIRHGDAGVRVSVLCPQAVRTPMTEDLQGSASSIDGKLEPEAVAGAVADALQDGRFLILPHPEVLDSVQRKAADPDRWLRGMRRLRREHAPS
jgi:NAD(P)-dependent dehydrogenase (short-subunit alcohol dehydrogenase family)